MNGNGFSRGAGPPGGPSTGPEYTGRYLVLLPEGDRGTESIKGLSEKAGMRVARSADFRAGGDVASADADAIVLDEIGVAVISGEPERLAGVAALDEGDSRAIMEPERVVYAIGEGNDVATFDQAPGLDFGAHYPPFAQPADAGEELQAPIAEPTPGPIGVAYLEGYRDAIESLLQRARNVEQGDGAIAEIGPEAINELLNTYGLQITRVVASRFGGLNVRIAVLDTGMDLQHPDFVGRPIVSRSFIAGEAVQDGHGHGTHCIGTACGSRVPSVLPRYGVGHQTLIHAGKVLSNAGRGNDGGILAGIDWAIANQCRVISMSLGSPAEPGQTYSRVYENVARRALARNTLIIAAAGNESQRPAIIKPVGHPANCPSIMAVGAVNVDLQLAPFTTRGINPLGGQVDVVGPGVNVYSSVPMPRRYARFSGTSMATPHVAGIATLWLEARPGATASDLWRVLVASARRLPLPAVDVGSGLVQAP
jgi:subtilisin family serine protease